MRPLEKSQLCFRIMVVQRYSSMCVGLPTVTPAVSFPGSTWWAIHCKCRMLRHIV